MASTPPNTLPPQPASANGPAPSDQPADRVPVFKPLLTQEEIAGAVEALKMGWLGMGSYVGKFEEKLQSTIEAPDRHVVAVSTGHAALHLALLLAGVGSGDEVITPSFNNIADLQAILATGAQPVFADIDPDTLCVDPDQIESLTGPKTKAIIATDYACQCCDHDRVATVASQHGLRVIHDAAHSFGASLHGRKVGGFSDITMFSFDPVKTITCIDGGAIVVKNEQDAKTLREMRLIGMGQPSSTMYRNQRAWTYDVNRLGFRYHMANLHAKIGLAQLAKLDHIVRTRRQTCRAYNQAFAPIHEMQIPKTDFSSAAPMLYYLLVPEEQRDSFREHLASNGIDTGIHWQPGHWFTLFRDCRRGDLSTTEQIGRRIVSLPLHSCMPQEHVSRVIDAVRGYFGV